MPNDSSISATGRAGPVPGAPGVDPAAALGELDAFAANYEKLQRASLETMQRLKETKGRSKWTAQQFMELAAQQKSGTPVTVFARAHQELINLEPALEQLVRNAEQSLRGLSPQQIAELRPKYSSALARDVLECARINLSRATLLEVPFDRLITQQHALPPRAAKLVGEIIAEKRAASAGVASTDTMVATTSTASARVEINPTAPTPVAPPPVGPNQQVSHETFVKFARHVQLLDETEPKYQALVEERIRAKAELIAKAGTDNLAEAYRRQPELGANYARVEQRCQALKVEFVGVHHRVHLGSVIFAEKKNVAARQAAIARARAWYMANPEATTPPAMVYKAASGGGATSVIRNPITPTYVVPEGALPFLTPTRLQAIENVLGKMLRGEPIRFLDLTADGLTMHIENGVCRVYTEQRILFTFVAKWNPTTSQFYGYFPTWSSQFDPPPLVAASIESDLVASTPTTPVVAPAAETMGSVEALAARINRGESVAIKDIRALGKVIEVTDQSGRQVWEVRSQVGGRARAVMSISVASETPSAVTGQATLFDTVGNPVVAVAESVVPSSSASSGIGESLPHSGSATPSRILTAFEEQTGWRFVEGFSPSSLTAEAEALLRQLAGGNIGDARNYRRFAAALKAAGLAFTRDAEGIVVFLNRHPTVVWSGKRLGALGRLLGIIGVAVAVGQMAWETYRAGRDVHGYLKTDTARLQAQGKLPFKSPTANKVAASLVTPVVGLSESVDDDRRRTKELARANRERGRVVVDSVLAAAHNARQSAWDLLQDAAAFGGLGSVFRAEEYPVGEAVPLVALLKGVTLLANTSHRYVKKDAAADALEKQIRLCTKRREETSQALSRFPIQDCDEYRALNALCVELQQAEATAKKYLRLGKDEHRVGADEAQQMQRRVDIAMRTLRDTVSRAHRDPGPATDSLSRGFKSS